MGERRKEENERKKTGEANLTELKLDYDEITFSDVKLIFYHRGWLVKHLGLERLEVSKTRHGYHVRLFIEKRLEDRDILLAQILLGSDINREIYNFVRILDGQLTKDWNRLYTKKHIILGTRIIKDLGGEKKLVGYTRELTKMIEECNDSEESI